MALPKRRVSRTVGKQRRTHWKLDVPSLSACSTCGEPKMPHRLCLSCGNYRKKKIIEVE